MAPRKAAPVPAAPAAKRTRAKAPPLTAPTVATPRKKERIRAMHGQEPGARPLMAWDEENGLRPTATPGVYINMAGLMVDVDGVLLEYTEVKTKDEDRFTRILGGKADTPAKLLKAVALDPQLPLAVRVDAAKAAAPYFDRKKPIGIDGGEDGKPVEFVVTHKLQSMGQAELDMFEQLLRQVGPDMPTLLGPDDE